MQLQSKAFCEIACEDAGWIKPLDALQREFNSFEIAAEIDRNLCHIAAEISGIVEHVDQICCDLPIGGIGKVDVDLT